MKGNKIIFNRVKFTIFFIVMLTLSYQFIKPMLFNVDIVEMENNLKSELNTIQPPKGAILEKTDVITKSDHSNVTEKYVISTSYNEFRTYYDGELKNHGWKFVSEKDVKSWGQYNGEKEIIYEKGDMKLSVTYRGYDGTYAIGVSWRLK